MTINGIKYIDELIHHETRIGYRGLSLSFKLKKDLSEPILNDTHEEIELNLDKEDVSELLKILFNLYKEAYLEGNLPEDYDECEILAEEVRGVLEYRPEFGWLIKP